MNRHHCHQPRSHENESLVENCNNISTATTNFTGERRYDAADENNRRRGGASAFGTIFLIVNATLGAGLLNFPEAYDKSGGIIVSIFIQLFLLIFIIAALVILANCSDMAKTTSLDSTFARFCGHQFLCSICIVLYSFGCCITFIIIIGDQFDRVFATFYGMGFCNHWYLSRAFITTISCTICILPLCFFTRLDVLSFVSSIGCLTILYVLWTITYESVVKTPFLSKPMRLWPDNAVQALRIIPVVCFSYQGHLSAVPTYACMKKPSLKKFAYCSATSMMLCFASYTVAGVAGYAAFGSGKVPSDVLQGYDDESLLLSIALLAIALKISTTYPIILYCGRDALFNMLELQQPNSSSNNTRRSRANIFTTISWFATTLALATWLPDISPMITILGTLSAAFVFIFPGICLLQKTLRLQESNPQLLIFNKDAFFILAAVFMIALGTFVCGLIFIESLGEFRNNHHNLKAVDPIAQKRHHQLIITSSFGIFEKRLTSNLCDG